MGRLTFFLAFALAGAAAQGVSGVAAESRVAAVPWALPRGRHPPPWWPAPLHSTARATPPAAPLARALARALVRSRDTQPEQSVITPGVPWYDTNGVRIHAVRARRVHVRGVALAVHAPRTTRKSSAPALRAARRRHVG